jgi:hypothetical protein
MIRKSILATALLLALAYSPAVQAENAPGVLANIGFESWTAAPAPPSNPKELVAKYGADGIPSDWRPSIESIMPRADPNFKSDCGIYRDDAVKHGGKSSVRFETGLPTDIDSLYQMIPVEPNTRYKISVWVKGENLVSNDRDGVRIWANYGPATDYWKLQTPSSVAPTVHDGTFDWEPIEVTVNTNKDAALLVVNIQLRRASGKAWFDDVAIAKLGPVAKVESF